MTKVLITWWKDEPSTRVARLCCFFFAVCSIYMENKVTRLPGSPCLLARVTLLG